ncbi:MAG: hypothetical protein ACRDBQ_18480 [Shewanella sp.]
MFSQADLEQVKVKGRNLDPSSIQLAELVKNNHVRIRNYFENTEMRVASGHLIARILSQACYAGEPNYEDVEWACKRRLVSIGNATDLISPGNFGKLFNGAFIEGQDELISLVVRPVDPNLSFRDYTPARYLYHEYSNVDWQLGTNTPRGISIIEINLVALLWQYIKGTAYYREHGKVVTDPVFIWRHVVSKMLGSYMDIATLNIHRAIATGTPVDKGNPLRTIPVPAMRDLIIRNAERKRTFFKNGNFLPGSILYNIPLFFEFPFEERDGLSLIFHHNLQLPYQARWHGRIVNWFWSVFCLNYRGSAMEKFLPELLYDIGRFLDSGVLGRLPKQVHTEYHNKVFAPLYQECENLK